ncbi:hypothetical protein NQ318_003976 [Aromia moschata]|uniref:Cwf19-like C-terminal domain-containing protein n=1 Tax=Aromia moschata TaxID=1265417 RepID=A0AAV8ZA76_9CUCU|nr:hypothetical protein NQ318_003976 [Aromia moschata]
MTEKQKILLCGDVEGRFEALFKRVETINKKSGPFDLLLCVGNFFGINNKDFIPYRIGDKKVPIPTYILGPNQEDHVSQYPSDDSEFELCNNMYYLGKRGIYTDSKGLKIAYISGVSGKDTQGPWTYSEKEVSQLCDLCVRGKSSFRGVDILLSSQWPQGIVAENSKISLSVNAASDLPSYLCMKLKPRYLVAGLEGVFYERPPFRCPSLGDHDTTMESVTRFIGLARVGNPNKDKWIYALSLTPMDKMKLSDLLQKTTDETPCPFNFQELESKIFKIKRKSSGPSQYFYDMNAPEDVDRGKRKPKKPRIEFDQSKCWFCLASPSVEKHLIVSVGNTAYLAAAKGGIVEKHFLICPIEHYQSSLSQPAEVGKEISQFKESIRKFYSKDGHIPVFFERNYKTSHMQLQAVPIPEKCQQRAQGYIYSETSPKARALNWKYWTLITVWIRSFPPKTPYFTVELPDGTVLYTKIQGSVNFPINFGRGGAGIRPHIEHARQGGMERLHIGKIEGGRVGSANKDGV